MSTMKITLIELYSELLTQQISIRTLMESKMAGNIAMHSMEWKMSLQSTIGLRTH